MTNCKFPPAGPGLTSSSLKILDLNVCLGRNVHLVLLVALCRIAGYALIILKTLGGSDHGTCSKPSTMS